ncbi:hypothetical protein DL240_06150 [Lujinxingia litoralis]|uniref:Uncharacterized protein n=1 Tax=Lujinxingia litoralis TaxID=2211119 RepID=A0A328C709_9DELT|nr:hypothetical protein [Lujinxingia litoralis]RAL23735.1 hypothetical protein DL240_06150 [Lujinxingia litoralis]
MENGRKIFRSESGAGDSKPETTPPSSTPGFGVVPRKSSEARLDDASEDAIDRLTRLAGDLHSGPKATMAGLPGGVNNPFTRDGHLDKTASVEADVLDTMARIQGNTTRSPFDAPASREEGLAESTDSGAWRQAIEHESSPGLRRASIDTTTELQSRKTVDLTRQPRVSSAQLRETAENQRVPRSWVSNTADAAREDTLEGDVSSDTDTADQPLKSQVLARIQSKQRLASRPSEPSSSPSDTPAPGQAQKLSLDKLRPTLSDALASAQSSAEAPANDGDDQPSLARLFKKAQQRRASQNSGTIPELPLSRSEPPSLPTARAQAPRRRPEDLPPSTELPEISDVKPATDKAQQGLADLLGDIPEKAPDESAETPDHSGLFDGFGAPEGAPLPGRPALPGVSRERGQTTSQSMLARLQARRRDPNVDPIELGTAGETRGSGYIRLPTSEIQDVLGRGSYRLRIEDVIYEPVDEEGLTQLIKSGVLLGAEELAEADGDWMPVSEHPVFGELRRKMAAEAHNVLSRIGTPRRKAPREALAQAPETPAFEPPLPVEASSNSLDFSLLDMEEKSSQTLHQDAAPSHDDIAPSGAEIETSEDIFPESQPEPSEPELDPFMELEAPVDEDSAEKAPVERALDEPSLAETPLVDTPQPEPVPAAVTNAAPPTRPDPSASASFDALPTRKKSSASVVAGITLGIGVLGLLGLTLTTPGQTLVEDTTGWNPSSLWVDHETTSPQQASSSATPSEDAPAPPDETAKAADGELLSEQAADEEQPAAEMAAGQPTFEELHQRWLQGEGELEFLASFANAAEEREAWSMVRQASLAALTLAPDDERFTSAYQRALKRDPDLDAYKPISLNNPAELSLVGTYNVDTHQGLVFKLSDSDDEHVFKPAREGWEDGWRMEIAAWRLCELIACNFAILKTTPAILTAETLEATLAQASDQVDKETIARLQSQAIWETDDDGTRFVRGSLERLPTAARAPFPIEYRPLWIDWLTASSSPRPLEAPLAEELGNIANLASGKFQQPLIDAMGAQPTSEVAREVSSLLLFDYLTNNWERFSTSSETYGLNNPVINGGLVSRHNGDAFQPRASRRVQGRFEWTTRFSRSTVATIRLLDRETLENVLFPEASQVDRVRLNVMWSQREDLLKRVDQLIAQHGQDSVLYFP